MNRQEKGEIRQSSFSQELRKGIPIENPKETILNFKKAQSSGLSFELKKVS